MDITVGMRQSAGTPVSTALLPPLQIPFFSFPDKRRAWRQGSAGMTKRLLRVAGRGDGLAAADLADASGRPLSAGIPRGPGRGAATSSGSARPRSSRPRSRCSRSAAIGFDAAILFSDILMLPWALGHGLRFEEGEGPVLPRLRDAAAVDALDRSAWPRRRADPGDRAAGARRADGVADRADRLRRRPVHGRLLHGRGRRLARLRADRRMAYEEPALLGRLMTCSPRRRSTISPRRSRRAPRP